MKAFLLDFLSIFLAVILAELVVMVLTNPHGFDGLAGLAMQANKPAQDMEQAS